MPAKDSKQFKFAESYKKLQELTEWFEKDEIDLEEGIKKYEEGIKLVAELKKYLETMENKVKELKKNI